MTRMFDDVTVLADLDRPALRKKLAAMGAQPSQDAAEFESLLTFGQGSFWRTANHRFGYIEPTASSAQLIQPASLIKPDTSLIGRAISVRLDRFFIQNYPGFGEHNILFTFKALHGAPPTEPVSFSQVYRARDGETVGVDGQMIFDGLVVDRRGVSFQGQTVNVKSSGDRQLLDVFGSGTFKAGLKLATTAQPLLAPFSELTLGMARWLAQKSDNAAVQDFHLGLDFEAAATGARLRAGSYVVAQVPEDSFSWDRWHYDHAQAGIRSRDGGGPFLYNHVIFRVSVAS